MKIKKDTKYAIPFFKKEIMKDPYKNIKLKTKEEFFKQELSALMVTQEEYDNHKHEIFIDNPFFVSEGEKLTIEKYLEQQWDYYQEQIKPVIEEQQKKSSKEPKINYILNLASVIARNDYDTLKDFLNSDEVEIRKIRESHNFHGFDEKNIKEIFSKEVVTNEMNKLGLEKIDVEDYVTKVDVYYIVKINTQTGNNFVVMDHDKNRLDEFIEKENLDVVERLIVSYTDDEEQSSRMKEMFQTFEAWQKLYPVITVFQFDTFKEHNKKMFFIDDELNILVNGKLSNFVETDDWQSVGKMKKENIVENFDGFNSDDVFKQLEEVCNNELTEDSEDEI